MSLRELIEKEKNEILSISARYGAKNVRLFGSVVRGEAHAESDIDFLVAMEPGRSLFDLVALNQDLEALLEHPVDVVTDDGISPYLKDRITAEALPL